MPYKITAKSSEKYLKAEAIIDALPKEVNSKVINAEVNDFGINIFLDTPYTNGKPTVSLLENPTRLSPNGEYTTAHYKDNSTLFIFKHTGVGEILFIKS